MLRRTKGSWSGLQLRPMSKDETEDPTKSFPEPAHGWDEFWDRLVAEGILALPDSSCFKDYLAIKDGVSYVVEINIDGLFGDFQEISYGKPNNFVCRANASTQTQHLIEFASYSPMPLNRHGLPPQGHADRRWR